MLVEVDPIEAAAVLAGSEKVTVFLRGVLNKAVEARYKPGSRNGMKNWREEAAMLEAKAVAHVLLNTLVDDTGRPFGKPAPRPPQTLVVESVKLLVPRYKKMASLDAALDGRLYTRANHMRLYWEWTENEEVIVATALAVQLVGSNTAKLLTLGWAKPEAKKRLP